ncbi:MAG TPA: tRNA uridine-5-carboxymethylaminomethyl(34) synthesis GTPase MnmE, partial [Chloroflexota bacterium]|nr:tRNA uridine-5-carboxymethylaminomethyl(34) synthesis GTPase MnmE [Chloroflexota bacterium]
MTDGTGERLRLDDTVAAIATGEDSAGAIGIVRLSGPDSVAISRSLFRPSHRPGRGVWRSHRLYHGHVVAPGDGRVVDEVLLAYMRAPRTYTGQDVVELSGHGGVAVREVLRLAIAAGARPAERGEMTLRAFIAGRLDLAQAEAVAAAVEARTPAALSLAVAQLGGGLSRRVNRLRAPLLELYAHLEATIDFDEDDVPAVDPHAAAQTLRAALDEAESLIETARWGQLYRTGVKIALVGRPNAGKSSLFNALLAQERAIVTPVAGTTRDVVEETIDLLGVPATLSDTAGMTESSDPVERLGVERSRAALSAADVALLVVDG